MYTAVKDRGKDPNENVEGAMDAILQECNIMGNTHVAEAILSKVSREHRTIQQAFVGELYKFLVMYASENYDLRNEASVRFAQRVKGLDAHFPFI